MVYTANDDDWEYDQYGNELLQEPLAVAKGQHQRGGQEDGDEQSELDQDHQDDQEEEYEYEYEQEDMYYEEEEYQESVNEPKEIIKPEVPPEHYWNDQGLLNCWHEALLDFKLHHPKRFTNTTVSKRSLFEKCETAPLWYGLFKPTPTSESNEAVEPGVPAKVPKKRKRGNNKSRRKRQALETPQYDNYDDEAEAEDENGPKSPRYTPSSPKFQRPVSPPVSILSTTLAVPAGPHLPSPANFAPPFTTNINGKISSSSSSSSSFPTSFPSPPPLVAVSADSIVEALPERTPEELLQGALWSWYNAGYQTGIYHASLLAGAKGDAGDS
ncbi:hypothetical protein T439DRAFT_320419 [Meredithblackwellia eburnea MCA 4105]